MKAKSTAKSMTERKRHMKSTRKVIRMKYQLLED